MVLNSDRGGAPMSMRSLPRREGGGGRVVAGADGKSVDEAEGVDSGAGFATEFGASGVTSAAAAG